MSKSPNRDGTRVQNRWRKILRAPLVIPWPFIVWLGGFILIINHEELLRQFFVLSHWTSYRHETLVVIGTETRGSGQHQMWWVIGRIGEQQVEADAISLGYSLPWGMFPPEGYYEAKLASAFPQGSQIEVLRCQECGFPLLYDVNPEIVSERSYGDLTWLEFLPSALLWNAVLLWGVYRSVDEYWLPLMRRRWRPGANDG